MTSTSGQPCPGPQTPQALDAFARELDDIRRETMAKVGPEDARYITRLLWVIRGFETAGRALLLTTPWLPTFWIGTALLGLSKCLQNMEFGHNVMHGQYDWMHDPRFDGKSHEWDSTCSKEDWRHFHNYMHHHYTNVQELDRDFGYGMLRLSAETPWEPRFLTQAPYAILVALMFEWAIAIHNMEFERLRTNREATQARIRALWPNVKAKMWLQTKKDYVLWPLVGGLVSLVLGAGLIKGLLAVLLGNVVANVIRNVWTFVVIFCGHFTAGVHTFDPALVQGEHKGHWYLRQILGSSNISGGKLFHIMTGNLSHQIEHHLYPDMPARRYADVAPRVREVCKRHGVPYNTGSLPGQLATVAARIVRHSFPGGERTLTSLKTSG
ncbi:MAG TPA: acyl-CoA desaturase [Aquabacterium sp.]|uniref:fatty acid desaturase family protein n=1 Tax=Aquabacterium sp. TaxID=1872578 RepID=UPI002E372D04|nr:acyl-CoA desaturase [Aquabacterium sp.]HEX5356493.1 acyl-CoA desaturase [Aquabacterium sp.]